MKKNVGVGHFGAILSAFIQCLFPRLLIPLRSVKDKGGTGIKRRNFLMCSRKLVLPLLMVQSENEEEGEKNRVVSKKEQQH